MRKLLDRRPRFLDLFILTAAVCLTAHQSLAADAPAGVTFYKDVTPLLYSNCSTCHRDGEAAPFPLLTFGDARKHAKQLVEVTSQRIMPPWKPEPGHGQFLGERRLSDDQINVLKRWVDAGCTEGNPAEAPPAPKFTTGWSLGEPDLVVKMPDVFTVPAEGRDIYRCFVIPVQIPEGKYIRAAEYRPGNRRVVHHAVLTTMSTASARKRLANEKDGIGPGFSSGLAAPGEKLAGPLGIWVPGWAPLPLPNGYAMDWQKGTELVLQLHLHPIGKAESEQSSVGFYFTDEKPKGKVLPVVLLQKNVDIPAGAKDHRLTKSITLPRAADVVGVFPHMHLLGRTVRTTATLPDGTTHPLLSINDWQFNWQGYYLYAKPVRLPAGTKIEAEWTFDNTAENPAQPSNPPKRVRFGEQTTDEMGAIILDVIPVQ
jgi:mono/diheme cytochrome c family protein